MRLHHLPPCRCYDGIRQSKAVLSRSKEACLKSFLKRSGGRPLLQLMRNGNANKNEVCAFELLFAWPCAGGLLPALPLKRQGLKVQGSGLGKASCVGVPGWLLGAFW